MAITSSTDHTNPDIGFCNLYRETGTASTNGARQGGHPSYPGKPDAARIFSP
jgi:hypothetical protein